MGITETQQKTETKLKRIAWLSQRSPEKKFESLMHLFNQESLTECFHQLDKNKAMGIDGINKANYANNLEVNIYNLITKMTNMAYRPSPVREVLIR